MMKIKSVSLALSVLAGAPAFAADREVKVFPKSAEFEQLATSNLSTSVIAYTQNIENQGPWEAKYAGASKLLALYPGYQKATLWSRNRDGVESSKSEDLVYYFARTKTMLNRASTAVDLKSLIKYGNIQAMVPDMRFGPTPINNDQLVASYLRKKQPIASFAWCNQPSTFISRQHREINLDEMMPPASAREPWCSRQDRSLCFEACVPLVDGPMKALFDAVMGAMALVSDERKDPGQALQAEIRYLVSEAEGGYAKGSFDELTKVGMPITGLVELNMFYMNQIVQYGKVVVVLQADPGDANKTVMTTLVVMGIKSHSWNSRKPMISDEIKSFLKGTSYLNKADDGTTKKGLMGGVPAFTKDLTQHLSRMLESGSAS